VCCAGAACGSGGLRVAPLLGSSLKTMLTNN
jgi:hypothetical protein